LARKKHPQIALFAVCGLIYWGDSSGTFPNSPKSESTAADAQCKAEKEAKTEKKTRNSSPHFKV
jgi:hypothetical protein